MAMDITFLIGNGFDVGLGMATTFKDFFPVYYAKSRNKNANIRALSEKICDDEDTWSYFEKQLGQYSSEFDANTASNFFAQINDFTSEFMEYLHHQEDRLSYSDTSLISNTITSALTSFYSPEILHVQSSKRVSAVFQKFANEEHRISFVSFNYTDTLEKCLATLKDGIVQVRKYGSIPRSDRVGQVVHVHGTRTQYPLMGVNDKTQIANQQFADKASLAERLIKPHMNNRIRMGYAESALSLINNSKIICIYGMSLGMTDKDWWVRIMSWLCGDADRQLIIFNYDEKFNASSPQNWFDKEDSIMALLAEYCKDTTISTETLRNRIHIAVHKNVFSMPLTAQSDQAWSEALAMLQST